MPRTHWFTRLLKPLPNRRRDRRGERFRPFLEALEDRFLLSGNIYTVNSLTDTGAHTSQYDGDIRYCVSQADSNPGSTIQFSSTLADKTIALTQGELNISDSMTITGLGAGSLTISGDHRSRVFDITAETANVTISDLTISDGSASRDGGGIINYGSLTVSDSTLSGNSTTGGDLLGDGGGIYNLSGIVTVSASTLSGNSATYGGGIWNGGGVTVSDCILTGNSATKNGGGIFNANRGSLTVSDSHLQNNSAKELGGGIYNYYQGSLNFLGNNVITDNSPDNITNLG